MKKLKDETRHRYWSNVREIAEALGIEVTPNQVVLIRDREAGETALVLAGFVEVHVLSYPNEGYDV